MDRTALLERAADLALQAGEVIRAVRAAGFETLRKQDRSPVTEADHQRRGADRRRPAGRHAAHPRRGGGGSRGGHDA